MLSMFSLIDNLKKGLTYDGMLNICMDLKDRVQRIHRSCWKMFVMFKVSKFGGRSLISISRFGVKKRELTHLMRYVGSNIMIKPGIMRSLIFLRKEVIGVQLRNFVRNMMGS